MTEREKKRVETRLGKIIGRDPGVIGSTQGTDGEAKLYVYTQADQGRLRDKVGPHVQIVVVGSR